MIRCLYLLFHTCIWFNASLAIGDEDPFGDSDDPFAGKSGLRPGGLKTFRVSKTGKNKDLLLRIFEDVRAQEASKFGKSRTDFMMFMEVRQRITATTYLVELGNGKAYWFIAKDPMNKVDGDTIECLAKITEEVKSYTSALNTQKSVRVIRELSVEDLNLPKRPPALTKEKFVTELKAGKTWTVTIKDKCKVCGGSGQLKSVSGKRSCKSCSSSSGADPFAGGGFSSGSGVVEVTYKVSW